MKLMHHRSTR